MRRGNGPLALGSLGESLGALLEEFDNDGSAPDLSTLPPFG
jgi:hypothetical protein